jgi:hypothetical protein
MHSTATTVNDQRRYSLDELLKTSRDELLKQTADAGLIDALERNYSSLIQAKRSGQPLPATIPDVIKKYLAIPGVTGPVGPTGGSGAAVPLPGCTGPAAVTQSVSANRNAFGVVGTPDELAIPEDLTIPRFMQRAPKSPDDVRADDGRTGADGAGNDPGMPTSAANNDLNLPFIDTWQQDGGHAPIPEQIEETAGTVPDKEQQENPLAPDLPITTQIEETKQQHNGPAPVLEKDLANFLSRVVPWPQPDMPGFINVHWRPTDRKGITSGSAFIKLDEALSYIEWAKTRDFIQDLYFCLSARSQISS